MNISRREKEINEEINMLKENYTKFEKKMNFNYIIIE